MDWNDFAERLAVELMWLPERSFLIVQRTGGLPYVQALRSRDTLEAEAVGSAYLPEPLTPQQERRLAANDWERPRDRDNWWQRVPVTGRSVRDRAERCTALALCMVAALRDAYDVPSPLDLVYQARNGETGEALELTGLGIPRSAEETEEPEEPTGPLTGTALEDALAAARQHGDQDTYLGLLSRAVLYLPAPADPTYDNGNQYATTRLGDETFVLAFTSPEAMDRSLRGQAVHHRETYLPELARNWPHPEWRLAVNPGLPSAGYAEADSLPRCEKPIQPPALRDAVMQKVLPHEHVVHYLEGGYDLVCGHVHLLRDVRDLDTPAKLVNQLGLLYEGTPFQATDEAIHVIRWPAHKPTLFRRRVTESPPSPGIHEFTISSQRLPHGAEMYRLDHTGHETLVAAYDADLRRWLPVPTKDGR
ncbi:hypothetical protein Acsp03_32560 [Actinomadura sp. NBRC 104412]|uniref:SseB family protein n=1 Tax=Actinomadura sp. NBRC 104412 TaxID=3032203 RepID=UPI0024A35FBD|nr:SseB family protein [Actinomadura sp. NBRC 104412]GLZ05790.1 hypothetical protein Acsp03_32560 [Actinomadura sp. NBRC 104412]